MTLEQFTYWLEGYLANAGVPFDIKKTIEAKLAECRAAATPKYSGVGIRPPLGARGGLVPDCVAHVMGEEPREETVPADGPIARTLKTTFANVFPGDGDQREALAGLPRAGKFGGGLT